MAAKKPRHSQPHPPRRCVVLLYEGFRRFGVRASNRVRTILAATAIALCAAASAQADPVDLRIVDRDTGQVLPVWRHYGRFYVVGRPGDRYSLRVINRTDGRVLVVMSVDGVNVLTGETAGYDQRGYVFSPRESYDVTGWRKSNTEVADFAFAPLSQSYAARTGRPTDVGVIGIAVFKEKAYVPPPEPSASEDRLEGEDLSRATPAPPPPVAQAPHSMAPASASARGYAGEAANAPRDEKLGTAHGAREWSVVSTVDFERATAYPQFVRQIEYDTYAHLVAAGVIPRAPPHPPRHPRPFPSSAGDEGYVPDPPDEP